MQREQRVLTDSPEKTAEAVILDSAKFGRTPGRPTFWPRMLINGEMNNYLSFHQHPGKALQFSIFDCRFSLRDFAVFHLQFSIWNFGLWDSELGTRDVCLHAFPGNLTPGT